MSRLREAITLAVPLQEENRNRAWISFKASPFNVLVSE